MPEIEEDEIIGSHTEDSEQHDDHDDHDDTNDDVYAAFGIEKPKQDDSNDKADDPAIDQKPEPRTIKVKHNKEEIEVDVSDEKLPEYVQKSLALDKERERKSELEKHLERAAKLAGYKSHAEYVADLDKLEQQQQQKEANAHNEMIAALRQQAEDAGLDPDQVEAVLNNHPLVKEGERIKAEREAERAEQQKQAATKEAQDKWTAMYKDPRVLAVFPDIVKDSEAFDRKEMPKFLTPEMKAKLDRGYDPIDAIMLAHADKFQAVKMRTTEQRLIKEQQLGIRARVETVPSPERETPIPAAHASAFAACGLPVEAARKYIKK